MMKNCTLALLSKSNLIKPIAEKRDFLPSRRSKSGLQVKIRFRIKNNRILMVYDVQITSQLKNN